MFAVNKLNPTVSLGLGNAIGLSGFDEPSSGFQWSFASEGASYITLQQFATFSFIIRLNLPQSFWLNRSLGFFYLWIVLSNAVVLNVIVNSLLNFEIVKRFAKASQYCNSTYISLKFLFFFPTAHVCFPLGNSNQGRGRSHEQTFHEGDLLNFVCWMNVSLLANHDGDDTENVAKQKV